MYISQDEYAISNLYF